MADASAPPQGGVNTSMVVAASAAGTAFEWYDFFVFGTLASIISARFTSGSQSAGFLFTLGAFAAGFIVRPFGALFFGHIGDRHGRKRAFIQTILLMGVSTMAIGLLPGIETIGVAAPILLVLIRVIQGFAMGGEYGGAAVYVAEHAHPARRGMLTGWIQSTAAVGLLLALGIVLATRTLLGEAAFQAWGWRVPFLMSSLLLAISLWIRLRLSESPAFQKMKAEMRLSKAPISDTFRGHNLRRLLTAQFYLERVLKMDSRLVNQLVMGAVVLSAGGYVFFGWLSDRWGRKPVMLLGMIISAAAYFPAFNAMTAWGNPGLLQAVKSAPVVVSAPQGQCHLQFDALGRRKLQSACDVIRTALADAGVPYHHQAPSSADAAAIVRVGGRVVTGWIGAESGNVGSVEADRVRRELREALGEAGYPVAADREAARPWAILGILVLLMLASTALYGPQAAALVELFPTQVRYTALSVPYNIGVGWVGGLPPVSAFALVAARGDINAGLLYPLVFTLLSIVCALLFLPETRGVPLDETGLPSTKVSRSHAQ